MKNFFLLLSFILLPTAQAEELCNAKLINPSIDDDVIAHFVGKISILKKSDQSINVEFTPKNGSLESHSDVLIKREVFLADPHWGFSSDIFSKFIMPLVKTGDYYEIDRLRVTTFVLNDKTLNWVEAFEKDIRVITYLTVRGSTVFGKCSFAPFSDNPKNYVGSSVGFFLKDGTESYWPNGKLKKICFGGGQAFRHPIYGEMVADRHWGLLQCLEFTENGFLLPVSGHYQLTPGTMVKLRSGKSATIIKAPDELWNYFENDRLIWGWSELESDTVWFDQKYKNGAHFKIVSTGKCISNVAESGFSEKSNPFVQLHGLDCNFKMIDELSGLQTESFQGEIQQFLSAGDPVGLALTASHPFKVILPSSDGTFDTITAKRISFRHLISDPLLANVNLFESCPDSRPHSKCNAQILVEKISATMLKSSSQACKMEEESWASIRLMENKTDLEMTCKNQ